MSPSSATRSGGDSTLPLEETTYMNYLLHLLGSELLSFYPLSSSTCPLSSLCPPLSWLLTSFHPFLFSELIFLLALCTFLILLPFITKFTSRFYQQIFASSLLLPHSSPKSRVNCRSSTCYLRDKLE